MKTYKIEVVIDEKGNIVAETKGMQGEICEVLDEILQGIPGEWECEYTADYDKDSSTKQTIGRG